MRRPSRLLLTVPDGYHVLGLVHSGVLDRLLADEQLEVTCLAPTGTSDQLPSTLTRSCHWLEAARDAGPKIRSWVHLVRMEASARRAALPDWWLLRRRFPRPSPGKRALLLLARLMAAVPAVDMPLRVLQRWGDPLPTTLGLDLDHFDVIVLGSAGVKMTDYGLRPFLRSARAGTYGIAYSWDNLSSKTDCFYRFGRLAVWNPLMKRTAVEALGYAPKQVAVVGPVQFDSYHRYRPSSTRNEFLRALRIPAEGRYVLYTGVPPLTAGDQCRYVEDLLDCTDDYVVIRVHPQDVPATFDRLREHRRVRLVDAASSGAADQRIRDMGFWVPATSQSTQLAEQLCHARLVVNVASTITLEALRLNVPVINIAYESTPDAPVAIEEFYRTAHYGHIVRSGAVPLASSQAELGRLVHLVDDWWPRRQQAADRLNRDVDPFQDGRAAQRLAEDILAYTRGAGGGETAVDQEDPC